MKRYAIFAWDTNSPHGGMNDFHFSFETDDE